jgi:hypothetical protein
MDKLELNNKHIFRRLPRNNTDHWCKLDNDQLLSNNVLNEKLIVEYARQDRIMSLIHCQNSLDTVLTLYEYTQPIQTSVRSNAFSRVKMGITL